MISKKNELSLKVLRESDDEFDRVLGMDGRPRGGRNSIRSIRKIEEVFDDMDELTGAPVDPETGPHPLAFLPPMETMTAGQMEAGDGKPPLPHPKNPFVIWNLGDLFSLCGPAVTLFIVAQVVSSLTLTHLIIEYLVVDHHFLDGMFLLASFVLDGIAFALFRGRIYSDWSRPLVLLSLLTVAPGVVAYVWCKILHFG